MIRAIRSVAAAPALVLLLTGGTAAAQKAGGILKVYSAESPPGHSIYEQATPWGQGPLMGVYNNLILFDQHVAQNSLEAIRPDLATKWWWNEDGTELAPALIGRRPPLVALLSRRVAGDARVMQPTLGRNP